MFFFESKLAFAQITDLFDFVWPTATAIWNLRWQVKGYVGERGEQLNQDQVYAKFGTHETIMRANLYRACIDTEWEEQLEQFASILLVNAFAYYESWLAGIGEKLPLNNEMLKQIQFPSTFHAGLATRGIRKVIDQVKKSSSTVIKDAFFEQLKLKKKYHPIELENLMVCYRYFKELRNSLMHNGGFANANYIDAQTKYDLLSKEDLAVKEKPRYSITALGERVKIDLRGVVGFVDVILRLIKTLDTEFIASEAAETHFLNSWKEKHGAGVYLKNEANKRREQLKRLVNQCSFPRPDSIEELEKLLKSRSLIH